MKKIYFILTMFLLTACSNNEQVINPDLDATVEAMVDAKLKDIVSSPTPEILIKGGTGSLSIDENNEVEIDVELIVETPTKTPSPKPPISPTPTIPASTPTPTPEPFPVKILPTPTPIPFGEKVLPEGTFHFGSTYDEVIEAMGEPSFSFYEPGDEFNFYIYYRDDRANQNKVYFYNNKVIAWEDFGLLKLANLQKRPDKKFDVGSTVNDVIEIMGNPDKIENFYTDCCLEVERIFIYNQDGFSDSRIYFDAIWTPSEKDGYNYNIGYDYEVTKWFNSGGYLSVFEPTPTPPPTIVSVPTPTQTPQIIIVTPTPINPTPTSSIFPAYPTHTPTPTAILPTPTPTPTPTPIVASAPLNLTQSWKVKSDGYGNHGILVEWNEPSNPGDSSLPYAINVHFDQNMFDFGSNCSEYQSPLLFETSNTSFFFPIEFRLNMDLGAYVLRSGQTFEGYESGELVPSVGSIEWRLNFSNPIKALQGFDNNGRNYNCTTEWNTNHFRYTYGMITTEVGRPNRPLFNDECDYSTNLNSNGCFNNKSAGYTQIGFNFDAFTATCLDENSNEWVKATLRLYYLDSRFVCE